MILNNRPIYKASFVIIYTLLMGALLYIGDINRIQNLGPIEKDSKELALLGFYLIQNGTYSMDGVNPSHFREPFPGLINGLYLQLFDSQFDIRSNKELFQDLEFVNQITRLNMFLLIGLIFSIVYLFRVLDISQLYGFLANFLTIGYFSIHTNIITSVNTEIPAAIFLVLSIAFLLRFIKLKTYIDALLSGGLLGLLALSKAVFFYLTLMFLPFLILAVLILDKTFVYRNYRQFMLIGLAFCMVISPWMFRNLYHFGELSITERGGQVLYIRAVKNQMNNEEYKGAFYAYAPVFFQKTFFEKHLNYDQADLLYGGKLQRLNRGLAEDSLALSEGRIHDVVSFLRRAQIEYLEGFNPPERKGLIKGDHELKQSARKMILADIPSHLKTSILFGWRGIWFYRGRHLPLVLLTLFSFISLPILFFCSISKDKLPYLLLTLLPLLYFMFHAFLTHYIPRYTVPLLPILTVCLAVLIKRIFEKFILGKLNKKLG